MSEFKGWEEDWGPYTPLVDSNPEVFEPLNETYIKARSREVAWKPQPGKKLVHLVPKDGTYAYEIVRPLRQTSAGNIVLGRVCKKVEDQWKPNPSRLVMIKILNKERLSKLNQSSSQSCPLKDLVVNNELQRPFRHKNLTLLIDIMHDDKHYYGVQEYGECLGDLFDLVKARGPMPESLARKIFQSMLMGVAYLHKRGVVHRDLALDSWLLNRCEAGLRPCLFDLSHALRAEWGARGTSGKPHTCPREVFLDEPRDDTKSDMWALGVSLFTMLTGGRLYDAPHTGDPAFKELKAGRFCELVRSMDLEHKLSKASFDLLRRLLSYDPSKRPSAEEALCHIWIMAGIEPSIANQYYLQPSDATRIPAALKPCAPVELHSEDEKTEMVP